MNKFSAGAIEAFILRYNCQDRNTDQGVQCWHHSIDGEGHPVEFSMNEDGQFFGSYLEAVVAAMHKKGFVPDECV